MGECNHARKGHPRIGDQGHVPDSPRFERPAGICGRRPPRRPCARRNRLRRARIRRLASPKLGFPNQRDAPHSVTFVHPDWPCDIDLHRYFPGLLAHPPDVFEAFWARRTRVEFAHKPCEILDRPSSLIVMTLNHLRSRASDDLNPRWSAMELSDVEREQLARLARRTGADLGLWEHLVSIGITPRTVSRALIIEAGTGRHGRRLTALALRHSTTRDRLHIVGRLMRGPAAERGDSASWTRRWRRNFRGLVGLATGQFGSRQDR